MIVLEKLEASPLMQLNIFLAMSLPGRQSWVNPYFYEKGYEILSIEPELSLPPTVIKKLVDNDFEYISSPRPELILYNQNKGAAIILECKNNSFDINQEDKRERKQLISFFIYNHKILSDSHGLPGLNEDVFLLYNIMQTDYLSEFNSGLSRLKLDLENSGFKDLNIPLLSTLNVKDKNLYFTFYNENLPDIFDNDVRVMYVESGNVDPSLYIIPIDSTGQTDKLGEIVFRKRLKNQLIQQINNIYEADSGNIDIEIILKNIINVWDVWFNDETKKYIKRIARDYINDILRKLEETIKDFEIEQAGYEFKILKMDRDIVNEIKKEYIKVGIKREDDREIMQIPFDFN
ncbi:MAG: hypothetical protein ACOCVD_03590 [Bacillota bacterium]